MASNFESNFVRMLSIHTSNLNHSLFKTLNQKTDLKNAWKSRTQKTFRSQKFFLQTKFSIYQKQWYKQKTTFFAPLHISSTFTLFHFFSCFFSCLKFTPIKLIKTDTSPIDLLVKNEYSTPIQTKQNRLTSRFCIKMFKTFFSLWGYVE